MNPNPNLTVTPYLHHTRTRTRTRTRTVIQHPTVTLVVRNRNPYLIDQLSGIAIERKFLNALDPETQAGPGGQTAGERIATLEAKLLEIKELSSRFTPAFASADEAKQSQYLAKMKAEGELAAMRWLVNGK